MRLLLVRLPLALGMGLLYVLLTGNLEWANWAFAIVVGAVLGCLVPVSSRPPRLVDLPRAGVAAFVHIATVAWDVFVNGLLVASLVVWRTKRVRPGLVPMPDPHPSDLGSALDAHAITISPGQMVLGFEPGTFQVHCLEAQAARDAGAAAGEPRRRRIRNVLGEHRPTQEGA